MEDWYTRGEEAFLKAYGRYDIVLEKGEGVYLYDTKGRRYLDFLCRDWCQFVRLSLSSLC